MTFSEFLKSKIKEKGVSLEELSNKSGVSIKHLRALLEKDVTQLPATPYVRGYLSRLGTVLGFDPEEWWIQIQQEELSRSGESDQLPKNRFVLQRRYQIALWAGIPVIAVFLYLIIRLPSIIGVPEITVQYPDNNFIKSSEEVILVRGFAVRTDEIQINNERVAISEDGQWKKTVALEMGLNTIEIRAKKTFGKETVVIRQVMYELPPGSRQIDAPLPAPRPNQPPLNQSPQGGTQGGSSGNATTAPQKEPTTSTPQ